MAERGSLPGRIGRRLVRAVDALLRRDQRIFSFNDDPGCILRMSLEPARDPMALTDGTTVQPGDPLVILHFWNERLPPVPPEGPNLRWARTMIDGSAASLGMLSRYLAGQPDLAAVRAIGSGLAGFLTMADLDLGSRFFGRLGFDVRRGPRRRSLWGRFAGFWENIYSWALIWTYNPASVRGKPPWRLGRFGIWMSRATLERRYGRTASTGEEAPAGEPALASQP